MGCLDLTDLLLILALTFQSRHLGLREHQAFLGGFLLQGPQAQPDSPQTMAQRYRADPGGIGFALVMGCIGGLFPAIRAARLPVAKALREA